MSESKPRIEYAYLESFDRGHVELKKDWKRKGNPPLSLNAPWRIRSLKKLSPVAFGRESGYFFEGDQVIFLLDPLLYPFFKENGGILLGGDFNDWNPFADEAKWRLQEESLDGGRFFILKLPRDEFPDRGVQFKFATAPKRWLAVPDSAPNRRENEQWNANLEINPEQTGHHLFTFELSPAASLSEEIFISWRDSDTEAQRVLLMPGDFFYRIASDRQLGAEPGPDGTRFAVFAPRASRAEVVFSRTPVWDGPAREIQPMKVAGDGVWEVSIPRDLTGWYYWYRFDGPRNFTTHFDPDFPVVDPYARALVSARGPGVITGRTEPVELSEQFDPPKWHDLIMAEVHLRDALANAPLKLSRRERNGFAGMRKWIQEESCYLRRIGVNAVELQPVQEFDNENDEEYHWGYMPVNYFSPESSYSLLPAEASQVNDLRAMVRAFHDEGLAVVLDVVYNHVGNPNGLLFIDKRYYFETDAHGGLLNWSGCGNDLRCDSAMARRLVLDSLRHLVQTCDVDGFRFDLAELIGAETLAEIERELKRIKPGIILIAEPWSFRGHIARQLRETGFSSWNDGYRDFMKTFVWGKAEPDAVVYFIGGSQADFASWPAQTVNYSESHDDYCWIDSITERPQHNGFHPTPNDIRRTRLMAAFLFSSLGIPMLAAGQDFLRSKHGVSNTYQRGDLNALDYERITHFRETHEFFRSWIRFRSSERGRLFRLEHRPSEGYLRFHFSEDRRAFAVLFNADGSSGAQRLLVAFNPVEPGQSVSLGETARGKWSQLGDSDGIRPGAFEEPSELPERLEIPPLGTALWEAI